MHIHILGICGTFMGGIALIAKAMGHEVSGADANVYPPMSTQLEDAGIAIERRVPHVVGVHDENRDYLRTKKLKMGHLLKMV